jgi:hypothetical protein
VTLWLDDGDVRLYVGDVRDVLAGLPDESVDCCITSPPYWGLRDYGSEGQLGLEATPDLYVANMVAVFSEVRRVLADHGTLWLNLGDSYAGSWGNQGRKEERGTQRPINGGMLTPVSDGRYPDRGSNTGAVPIGLKPKDLCGIPWSVAKALQAPYYTGRIKDERDRIWLAAVIEAEGCMFIHKRKVGQSNGQGYVRKNDSYGAGLEVSSTDRVIVETLMRITGIGSICEQTPEQNERRKQTIYRWNLRSNECREVIREVYPHLYAKQHEARLLLGCPPSGPDAEKAHESLKAIHQGGTPTSTSRLRVDVRGWVVPPVRRHMGEKELHAGVGDGQADEGARVRVPAVEAAAVLVRRRRRPRTSREGVVA